MKSLALAFIIVPHVECSLTCGLPVDVMFLQDTTGSFDNDLPLIMEQLPIITSSISSAYKGSRFGVAEFRDKPFYPLGQSDDFCYKLNTGKLTDDLSDFYWAYEGLLASGGADAPESSFQALINVALDPAVGWSGANRVVILNTDAVTHLPGDMEVYPSDQYPEVPHGLPPNSGGLNDGDLEYSCLFEDYPTPFQVRDVLKSQNILLFIMTPDDYQNVTASWTWVNEQLLEQPAGYYQIIEDNSSDIAQKIIKVLNEISPECPVTTPVPTTLVSGLTSGETTSLSTQVVTSDHASVSMTSSTMKSEGSEIGETDCTCLAPCPPPCADPCCNVNEVMVFLKHKPSHLHMEIRN